MKNLLNYLQSIRHKMFHTKVRWTSKDAYTCMECFGREYKAGWVKEEEKESGVQNKESGSLQQDIKVQKAW